MRGRVVILAGGIAALVGFAFGFWHAQPTELVFLSVGQGDCAVFRHEGATVLVDTGPGGNHLDAGQRIVLPRLREMGVTHVDLILLSHPDSDHTGGTASVLRAFPSARLGISAEFRHHPALLSELREWGVEERQVLWMAPWQGLRIGDCHVTLACPPLRGRQDDNAGSMFTKIVCDGATAVLSGDAPRATEDLMAAEGDWSADVMKAGHHGSRTATGPEWLAEVHPKYAVISCGRSNSYGHPHREVVDELADAHIETFRTDRQGDIAFRIANGHFTYSSTR